ncbi:MAG: ABC transporter ATP-binding protein [Oscillospiraceae bacterium]|nr:ABC transporter ATP-binding protein [Oscillospiraceae bacterium]
MNAIEIKNLSKHYQGFSLENLNLILPSGCIMGLVGENGAGKSTTIRMILGMARPDSGEITVFGQKLTAEQKERIGVVLDEPGYPSCMNAAQIGKMLSGIYRGWEQETYAGYLTKLRIPEKKPFKDFSKGMKMKLCLAAALSHGASLLILDEATSGLDPVVRDELLDIFNDFTRDEGNSVLISSHIVSDLEKICDYIAFLHKGRLMLCREKDELLNEYAFVQGSREEIDTLNPIGRRDGRFGTEAIVRRGDVPAGMKTSPITIEDLFVFMAKEEGR